MSVDRLRTSEIPELTKVVIASNYSDDAVRIRNAWCELQPSLFHSETQGVLIAGNADDLLLKALGIENGRQAEIVCLDDNYDVYPITYHNWEPTEETLSFIAQKTAVDFEPLKKPDRGRCPLPGEMPDYLYRPNSAHFALLLRYFGFSGKIVVISKEFPELWYIYQEFKNLKEHLGKFGQQIGSKSVDAVLQRRFLTKDECYYASSTYGFGWNHKKISIENPSEAIRTVLESLYSVIPHPDWDTNSKKLK